MKRFITTILFLSLFILNSCVQEQTNKSPKYIFLFIGDGMGLSHVALSDAMTDEKLTMLTFPTTGSITTFAEDRYITDSAAAGTALATGEKTSCGTISQDSSHTRNIETMAEIAKKKGMKVGIVSSVSIDHATPACFYAHQKSRSEYYDIAIQMASSNFDYFGGGFAKGNREKYGPGDIVAKMDSAGYSMLTKREELVNSNSEKIWAYNNTTDYSKALYYEIDRPEDHIKLSEFTKFGIEHLANDNGFFMMVEGGRIDWASHGNDGASMVKDLIEFDNSVAEAVKFYNEHPNETLIIVTADHETGGLALGNALTGYQSSYNLLNYQKISQDFLSDKVSLWKKEKKVTYEMAMDSIKVYFGLGDKELNPELELIEYETKLLKKAYDYSMTGKSEMDKYDAYLMYGGGDPFSKMVVQTLNTKASIGWPTFAHTAYPVPVFAIGQGHEEFTGYYDNTDLAKKIIKLGKLNYIK
ncbi:MAG: alkaline phosphatase [Candidatus Delongbacteria bacterium]|nr:alkaline phosphatase [Candidatus Delongbacteria bacterium]